MWTHAAAKDTHVGAALSELTLQTNFPATRLAPLTGTAVRLDESAQSHRIASMYEEIAERTSSPDECRECASRHRVWAREDRLRAAKLRRTAEREAGIDMLKLPE